MDGFDPEAPRRVIGRIGGMWPSKRAADAALRAINAGMLAWEAGKPLPEWALKATAAGWTPPKGWSP